MAEHDLYSQLSPDECYERLRATVGPPLYFGADKAVIGTVGRSSATLQQRRHYRNSFQTVLRIVLTPEDSGTRLTCSTDLTAFALAGLFVSGGVLVFTGLVSGWPMALISVGMLIVLGLIFLFCRELAKDEASFLLDFLRQTLDAHDVPPRPLGRQPPNSA